MCAEADLRQKFRLVPLQPLQSFQEEWGFSERQEASDVGGRQGHHLTVLIQHLVTGRGQTFFRALIHYLLTHCDSCCVNSLLQQHWVWICGPEWSSGNDTVRVQVQHALDKCVHPSVYVRVSPQTHIQAVQHNH